MALDDDQQNRGSKSRIANYRKILDNNPKSFIFAQLAEEYIKLDEVDKAIAICLEGLAHNPDFGDGLYVLGVAHFKIAKKEEGRRIFFKILQLQPDHYLAREALRRMGISDSDIDAELSENIDIGDLLGSPSISVEPAAVNDKSNGEQPQAGASKKDQAADSQMKAGGSSPIEQSVRRSIPSVAGDIRSAQLEGVESGILEESEKSAREWPGWLKPVIVISMLLVMIGAYFGVESYQDSQARTEVAELYKKADGLMGKDTLADYREVISMLETGVAKYPKSYNLQALLVEACAKVLIDFMPKDQALRSKMEKHFATFPVAESSGDSDMLIAQAYNSFYKEKYGEVRFLLDTAGEKGLLSSSGTCLDGELHALDRKWEKAIALFKETLADDPGHLRALFKKAMVHLELKEYAEVKIAIDLLLDKEKDHDLGRLALGESQLNSGGDPQSVRKLLEPVLHKGENLPSQPYAWLLYLKGMMAHREGKLDKAFMDIGRSAELRPEARVLFLLAQIQYERKLFDKAKASAIQAIKLDPNEKLFHAFLGRLYFMEDNKTEALGHLESAIDKSTDKLDLLVMAGDAASALRMFDKAVDYYERASFVNFQNLDLKKKLILTYIEKQDMKDARIRIEKLLLDHERDPVAHFLNGRYRLAEGSTTKARKAFKVGLKIDPDNRDLRMELIELDIAKGKVEDAVTALRSLEKLYPDDIETLQKLARISLASGAYKEARRLYERLQSLQPQISSSKLYLALLDYLDGNKEQARQVLDEELARDPELGLIHILKGAFLYLESDPKKAAEAIQKGIQFDSKNPEGHYFMGKIKLLHQDLTWAMNEFQLTLDVQKIYPLAQYEIGIIHFNEGRFGPAQKTFINALKTFALFPEEKEYQVKILLRLGEIEISRNHHKRGLNFVRQAADLDPMAGEPYYIMARDGNKFRNPRNALRLLDKAIKLNPDLAEVWYERGIIYMSQDKVKDAVNAFRRYLKRDPKGRFATDAKRQLDELVDM